MKRHVWTMVFRAAFCIALATAAKAQYFGQNQVRFKSVEWKVLQTQHFDVYYYDEEAQATTLAGQMAERWYTRLSSVLNHQLPPNQPLIFYDSHPAFRQTTVLPGISVGTGGVTEGLKRRVIMPMAGPLADTDHVLGHELVHAFQYHMTSGPGSAVGGDIPGAATLPLWFIEGMAEYLSVGPVDTNTAMWLRDAVRREKLPKLKDLEDPRFFPYRFGQAFWSYVGGRYGDAVIGRILVAAGRRGEAASAIQQVLNIKPDILIDEWHKALRDTYEPVLRGTGPASEVARAIVEPKDGDTLLVSPVISPDGSRAAVFSARDLFAVEMFLIDTSSGDTVRKLTSTAVDPHLDSLEFIYSTGAWSNDGTRFAYPSLYNGRPRIKITNPGNGDDIRELEVNDLGEIYHLDWSPDARQIVFAAIKGGLTDLYIIDVETGQYRALTNDAYAELHPAWSPDGSRIAFATDRFGTNLDTLAFAPMSIATIDVNGSNVTRLGNLPRGRSINPNWSPDGRTVYFISDNNGVPNVYRVPAAGGGPTQITGLETGATGIAPTSPALSVASKTGTAIFSVFREGGYGLYALAADQLQQRDFNPAYRYEQAATLPPLARTGGVVAEALDQPGEGLPTTAGFTRTNYKARLQLDYFSQPQIGVGVGSYGAQVGGGLAVVFSDLLNRHQLITQIQTNNTSSSNPLRNIGGTVAYINRERRWDLGIFGGRVPYVTGAYGTFAGNVEGTPVVGEQEVTYWQTSREVGGLAAYPFNRAMRMEFTAGFRSLGFAGEQRTFFYDPVTGQFLGSTRDSIDAPPAINLGMASTALVYDTSIFGGVSPVWGSRWRLEFGANQGSLSFTTALADYRKYFRLPGNIALAGRLMHYGRYGGGAEDNRQQDLFIGYPALLRGYGAGTFDASECGPDLQENGSCPVFDQLLGSRMAVANAEVRFPMIGALGLIPRTRGLPPVEVSPFYDIGIAWRRNERAFVFQNGSRDPVRSYGLALRANLLGFAIGQFSWARPMDRPGKNTVFEFSLIAGF